MKKLIILSIGLLGLMMTAQAQENVRERNIHEGDTVAVGTRTYAYYADQYAEFEQMAKRYFGILTRSGSANAASRPIRGFSKMSPSEFNTNSSMLRTAQRQMRQVRNQASADGHDLPPSPWEEATVEYASTN